MTLVLLLNRHEKSSSLHKFLAKLLVWSERMHDKDTDMPSSCFVITVNFGQY